LFFACNQKYYKSSSLNKPYEALFALAQLGVAAVH